MKNKFLITIFLTISVISCYAQMELSLEDCLDLARKNNLEIKKSKLIVEDADYAKKNIFTKYFPTINATGFGMKANSGLLEADLYGMELSLIKEGFYGGISLTQPVFVGGQIVNANRLSNKVIDFQKIQLDIITDKIELITEQYYWQYFQIKEKLKTVEKIELLVSQTFKEVSLSVEAGLITSNNELQVKLKLDEIAATKLQLQNNFDILKLLLAQHIGVSSESITISDTISYDILTPATYFMDYEVALQENKTYSLLNTNIEISKYQTKMEKGKLLPTVAIGANYLFENIVDKNHTVGMAFVTVSIPISGWWGGNYSIKQKKINEKIAKYDRIDAGEKIMVQMHNYYKELEVGYHQIEIAKQSVESASENVRLNTNYYKAGTVTLNDLLDAQSLFQKAKDIYVDRYTEYMINLSKYKKTIGK